MYRKAKERGTQESSVETQTIPTYDDGVRLNNGASSHGPERPETQTDPLRGPRRRGPKTQAGKARVSTNALTHGIVSVRVILPGEASIEWETHRKNIIEALAPVGPLEAALAERAAVDLTFDQVFAVMTSLRPAIDEARQALDPDVPVDFEWEEAIYRRLRDGWYGQTAFETATRSSEFGPAAQA